MIYVLGSGGGGLNFEVVGGTTQPSGGGDTLTWDGNTEGLFAFADAYYKLSDVVPSLEQAQQGGTLQLVMQEQTMNIAFTSDNVVTLDGILGIAVEELGSHAILFVSEETATSFAIETGTYFLRMPVDGEFAHLSYLTINGYTGFGGKPIKENTIWVNTSTPVTEWELSSSQPASPTEGMVWIRTGESGKTAFSVLKKENVMVNPIRCDQYIDGVWTAKSASIYQAGEWQPFQKRLYWLGDLTTEIVLTNNYYATLVQGTDSLSFTDTNDMAESWWRFGEVLDGTYKTLYINITSKTGRFDLEVRNGTSHTSTKLATTGSVSGPGTYALDVSSITNGYIFFLVFIGTTVVNKVWLE